MRYLSRLISAYQLKPPSRDAVGDDSHAAAVRGVWLREHAAGLIARAPLECLTNEDDAGGALSECSSPSPTAEWPPGCR